MTVQVVANQRFTDNTKLGRGYFRFGTLEPLGVLFQNFRGENRFAVDVGNHVIPGEFREFLVSRIVSGLAEPCSDFARFCIACRR